MDAEHTLHDRTRRISVKAECRCVSLVRGSLKVWHTAIQKLPSAPFRRAVGRASGGSSAHPSGRVGRNVVTGLSLQLYFGCPRTAGEGETRRRHTGTL